VIWKGPEKLRPFLVDADTIMLHPENARRGNVEAIAASLDRFGQVALLRVQASTGYIVAGNHTYRGATERLGWDKVAAIRLDLDDDEARALMVADNRTGDLATYDDQAQYELLRRVESADKGLSGVGYAPEDLDALLDQLSALPDPPAPPADPDDAPPLPTRAKSRTGQTYELGPHRLVCGDARDKNVIEQALDGAMAETVWTDPPFGVRYESSGRVTRARKQGISKASAGVQPLQNDGRNDLPSLLAGVFEAIRPSLEPGCRFYICSAPGENETITRCAIRGMAGWRLHQGLVWVKDSMVLGHSDYHYRHETILYGSTKTKTGRVGRGAHAGSKWRGGHAQTSIFEVARPKRSELHPTMKPVTLIRRMLANSTRRGDVVLDPFAGSGSTLVACEMLDRRAVLVELDPKYCDVIRDRYAAFVKSRPPVAEQGAA
jgi:DNA modification methylase